MEGVLVCEPKTYRVETFIIPKNNSNKIFRSTEELDLFDDEEEKSDDVKPEEPEASEFVSENRESKYEDAEEEESDPFLRFDQYNLSLIEEKRSHSYDFLPSLKHESELKSIKESCEVFYGSCDEQLTCHHGNKNGCTVAAQSPSQVSEEIFKENWMQRLEYLRRRVTLIRDKEVMLQERERLLAKKEKELRILERLVKEKIQRADIYLKRCSRNSQNLEDDLHLQLISESRPSPPPYPDKRKIVVDENPDSADSRELLSAASRTSNRSTRSKGSSNNSTRSESSKGEKNPKIVPGKTSNGVKTSSIDLKPPQVSRSLEDPRDLRRSKWSAYGSWRCRSKPKMSYDDLDSTLSADIGDSSFAVTSKKLDPRVVLKPRGFSRSASERGPKTRPCSLDLDVALGPDGERVLRKISENISAVTQSQGTRFQDYGCIDKLGKKDETKIDSSEKKTTDLSNPLVAKDQGKNRKERTSFWNEEASDWLRKKRQAYNLATKRIPNRDYENKENFGNPTSLHQSTDKHSRTKNAKGKKFTIFR